MSRRALIIVENLPVPFDRRVWQEASALHAAGWDVSVICPKGKGFEAASETLDGIHVYRHPLPVEGAGPLGYFAEYAMALFWQLVLAVKVAKRHGFDVIHACNPPDLIFLVALVFKLFPGAAFVFDHHDLSPELFEAKFGRRGFARAMMLGALRFFEWCTFKCADVSIATNESLKRIAVERGGMAPEDVYVVKSYPDFSRFHRVPADPSLKAGRSILVGYVGIMARQDGVERLIEAMHHIVRARGRTDLGCTIIGDGPELPRLKAMAARLGLARYVAFPGYLSGQELLTHLSTVDIGVIPDPPNCYNDKISMNKVFEYMALGIPFVQFDLAVSRETSKGAAEIVSGDSSEALGDAILRLADDPARRARMSAFAELHAARNFRWETEQQGLLAAYNSVRPRPAIGDGNSAATPATH